MHGSCYYDHLGDLLCIVPDVVCDISDDKLRSNKLGIVHQQQLATRRTKTLLTDAKYEGRLLHCTDSTIPLSCNVIILI